MITALVYLSLSISGYNYIYNQIKSHVNKKLIDKTLSITCDVLNDLSIEMKELEFKVDSNV